MFGDFCFLMSSNLEVEIWLPVLQAEGLEISNFGSVRSYKGVGVKPKICKESHPIIDSKDSRGYCHFVFCKSEIKKTLYVHREVAKLFVPNPFNYKIVRHLNDIKTDNRAINLAWGTHKDNRADGIRNGKHFHQEGIRPVQRKLNEEIVRIIFNSPKNNSELGREYGVTESTISKIRIGRGWNHVTGLPRIK